MDVYAENILEHYRQPHGKHLLSDPTVTHQEINLSCGDEITLQLQIADGRIAAIGWSGMGCAISQASMSMLGEELEGKTIAELAELGQRTMYELLGVPIGPRRFKCALLSLHTLKNALRKANHEKPQGWIDTVGPSENKVVV